MAKYQVRVAHAKTSSSPMAVRTYTVETTNSDSAENIAINLCKKDNSNHSHFAVRSVQEL